jgi:FecR-like protein/putative zinc finger protein
MHVRTRINRYLAEGLPPLPEAQLRRHIRDCADCQSHYDQQVELRRILSGSTERIPVEEENRIVGLALRGAGLKVADQEQVEPTWRDRLVWAHPATFALAAAVLLVLTFGTWYLTSPVEKAVPANKVVAAHFVKSRLVSINGAPQESGLSTKTQLYTDTFIAVGRKGIAELKLTRGGTVRVFPGTLISLSESGDQLNLEAGRVWCMIEKRSAAFYVRTDTAEAWVVGTSFVVERKETGETDVRVMKGTVVVNDRRRPAPVLVGSRQKTTVTPDSPPSRPVAYVPRKDKSDWDKFVEALLKFFRQIGEAIDSIFN